jgi:amidohydrolase
MVMDALKIRKKLHELAELSGEESQTADFMEALLRQLEPDELVTGIGGAGICATFLPASPDIQKHYVVRAELDALSIDEYIEIPHRSATPGVAHKCGHDGHMAIVWQVAQYFSQHRIPQTAVSVLFQPAEETGHGAKQMLEDEKFGLPKHAIFLALHNIPGAPLGEVSCKPDVFSCASTGIIIQLTGKTSHAAEPEKGINPAGAAAQILEYALSMSDADKNNFQLITPIHVELGSRAFGTSAGTATLMFTLRTFSNDELTELKEAMQDYVTKLAKEEELEVEITYTETFDATTNDHELVSFLKQLSRDERWNYRELAIPYLWSEDFGYFTSAHRGIMFGLGSGEHHPPLHSRKYDFPDELLDIGAHIFIEFIKQHHGK